MCVMASLQIRSEAPGAGSMQKVCWSGCTAALKHLLRRMQSCGLCSRPMKLRITLMGGFNLQKQGLLYPQDGIKLLTGPL